MACLDENILPRIFFSQIFPTMNFYQTTVASCCLQSLIGPANLLSAISCYKFHISKDQQENMKFTIICHLAAFLFINSH